MSLCGASYPYFIEFLSAFSLPSDLKLLWRAKGQIFLKGEIMNFYPSLLTIFLFCLAREMMASLLANLELVRIWYL